MCLLEIVQIDDALGVILPEAALARLNLGAGDTIYLAAAPNGGITLTPLDPALQKPISGDDPISGEHQ